MTMSRLTQSNHHNQQLNYKEVEKNVTHTHSGRTGNNVRLLLLYADGWLILLFIEECDHY